jgi:hypothetical protein
MFGIWSNGFVSFLVTHSASVCRVVVSKIYVEADFTADLHSFIDY